MHAEWPIQVIATQDVACGVRLWRSNDVRRATLIVKATFALVKGQEMQLVNPLPLYFGDHHGSDAGASSVVCPNDMSPYLPRAELLFVGSVYNSVPRTVTRARLALYGSRPLIDKTLTVSGERRWTRDGITAPKPFVRLPMTYENALRPTGGIDENPVGVLAAEGAIAHHIDDPSDPASSAGFGPIGSAWPSRRRLLRDLDPDSVLQMEPSLPATFAWSYFHASPQDQRCPFLEGNEWLVLENLHPELPLCETRLPGARALARIYTSDVTEWRDLPLVLDTVWVDGDRALCSLTFRGNFEIESDEALGTMQIYTGLETESRPIPWPGAAPPEITTHSAEPDDPDQLDFGTLASSVRELLGQGPARPVRVEVAIAATRPGGRATGGSMTESGPVAGDDASVSSRPTDSQVTVTEAPFGERPEAPIAISLPQVSSSPQGPVAATLMEAAREGSRDEAPTKVAPAVVATAQITPAKRPAPLESVDSSSVTVVGRPHPALRTTIRGMGSTARPRDDEATVIRQLPVAALLAREEPVFSRATAQPNTDRVNAVATTKNPLAAMLAAGPRSDTPGSQPERPALVEGDGGADSANLEDDTGRPTLTEVPPHLVEPEVDAHREEARREVARRIRDALPMDGLDMSEQDLSGLDLSGRDLSGCRLDRCDLRGARLIRCDLTGASLEGADLTGANLDEANLTRANLVGARLVQTTLRSAQLGDANLTQVNAEEANLERATGERTLFQRANLRRSVFRGSSFSSADFTEAEVFQSNFCEAKLLELRAYELSGEAALFVRAELRLARFDGAELQDADFSDSVAIDSMWDRANADRSTFVRSDLSGASFTKASLRGADFSHCTLRESRFNRANLSDAILVGVELGSSTLDGADLSRIRTREGE